MSATVPTPLTTLELVQRVGRDCEEELFRRLRASGHDGLRPRHAVLLTTLDPNGSRLTDLAAHAGISPQAMGELVDDLSRAKFLARQPDPQDRRARLITFTAKGHEAMRDCRRMVAEIEREMATAVGTDAFGVFRHVLETVHSFSTTQR
jgi:DNA-binding MarR family transcriptional regulator